jgi:hypothetical protein
MLCTATTSDALAPGTCAAVSCTWTDVPLEETHDIWVIVDEAAGGPGAVTECREDNNTTSAEGVRCPPLIG